MNIKNMSPEEKSIRAKKSEMEAYESVAFICIVLAVLFFSTCFRFYKYVDVHELITWMPLAALGFLAMLCAGLFVVAWRGAARNRKLLAQLKAVAAQKDTPEQPGGLPPPSKYE